MTETPHIFDEFPFTEDIGLRHRKRMNLEPLIFDILKNKYFKTLKGSFQSYKCPEASDSAVCIFEGRVHANLEFLVYNVAYFAPQWKILIFCSDVNRKWLEEVLGSQKSQVEFREIFQGSSDRVKGRDEYNTLLRSKELYDSIPQEYLLFLETDCYIRKPLPQLWKDYDFCACPAAWDEAQLVGGASYRRNSAMKKICDSYMSDTWAHDIFMNEATLALTMKRPTFEQSLEWFTESCLYEDPIVVHQWWTFFSQGDDAEVFHSLLRLQV